MPINIARNLGLKIVSVFIAILLWLVVSGEQPVERNLRVPLEVRNLPLNLEVVDLPVETVQVRVRGGSGALGGLSAGDVVAVLDLEGVGPGRRLFDMTADQIETPFGVEVAQVNPPTLTLRFETSGSRTLPIAPAITGEVAPGYVVTEVTSEPAAVEVIGPQSALRQLSEVLTEPVSVEGATVAVRQVVAIGAAGTTVRLRRPQRATVVATVVPAEARRTLNGIPVVSRNVGPGLTAMTLPAVVSVTVGGPQTVLSSIVSGTVVAYVDLSGLGAGVHELPVRVERGPSFGVATVSPAVVQVIVE